MEASSEVVKAPLKGLVVPSIAELERLSPRDRWDLEDTAVAFAEAARPVNDAELRRWVEVEGKTQTEIAQMVGRDQSTISYRCDRLGIEVPKGRGTKGGRPKKVMDVHNPPVDDDPELVEGEVVSDDELTDAKPDPGPRVKCPTCGHMVKPDDIGTWDE